MAHQARIISIIWPWLPRSRAQRPPGMHHEHHSAIGLLGGGYLALVCLGAGQEHHLVSTGHRTTHQDKRASASFSFWLASELNMQPPTRRASTTGPPNAHVQRHVALACLATRHATTTWRGEHHLALVCLAIDKATSATCFGFSNKHGKDSGLLRSGTDLELHRKL